MKLEIERRNLLDPDVMEVLLCFSPADVRAITIGLNKAINTDMAGCTRIPADLLEAA
jgi:hypothetical protein